MTANNTQRIVGNLLAAIESRDLREVQRWLSPNATWQNVPHEVATGRDDVVALLARILNWSDRVQWDVVSASYTGDTGWLERVDRFWLDGNEYGVKCNGVFVVDPTTETVAEVRDYVDLGEWRQRVGAVYETLAGKSATSVVQRHITAVEQRDVVAMAADYTLDAKLHRAGDTLDGWRAIVDYFDTVPNRLANRSLTFGEPQAGHDQTGQHAANASVASVQWTITDGATAVASGTDQFVVVAGRVIEQTVYLNDGDF